ncbi:hypothetical protein [Methylopila sp. M107]|uniref:hypothetical protein n=1 Tax=Methylopila sp. M107 TaxID=1101190 RepID=UPI00035DD4B4|nr:hypothetical protein [Methylopila sp. M107]
MRTCYLHIGAPKTGSTSIQGFLAEFRGALLERGVDVPDFGEDDLVKGQLALSGALSRETNARRPRSAPWRWLDRHLARTADHVCISREGLFNHLGDETQLGFAKSFFRTRGVKLKPIGYVRDSVGFLNAAYAQQAKKFRTPYGFDNWLIGALDKARYSYWRRLRLLATDPDLDVSIKPLHRVGSRGLLTDFCREIGCPDIDASGFDDAPYRNATPGPKALAAAVLVSRGLKERGVDPDFDPSLHRRFELATEARNWGEAPFFGPGETTTERIEAAFAEGNETLARTLWATSWAEAAPTTRRPQNVFDLNAAPAEELREVEDLAQETLALAKSPAHGWRRLLGRDRPAG